MPQVINTQDAMTGQFSQRISLTRGPDFQINFAPDRIDFISMMPSESLAQFTEEVVICARKLEKGSLIFSRISLVEDILLEEINHSQSEALREKLLPHSGENSIEWMARWVTQENNNSEQYNVCFEAINNPNLMMIHNGRMHTMNGIKLMSDVSTTHTNTIARFDIKKLPSIFSTITKIISSQADFIKS